VIHNDANDYNVLVEPDGKWRNRVSGVIDFGDMVFSYTIGEVAIACAYAMLNKADPLAAAASIVAGYHQNRPLAEQELDVLFDLICMRLCMSVSTRPTSPGLNRTMNIYAFRKNRSGRF
jgi:Ser/Thr protein kinase RdoA (MazF antagonist)